MDLPQGLYEQLITQTLRPRLEQNKRQYHIAEESLDPEEAARYLSSYL